MQYGRKISVDLVLNIDKKDQVTFNDDGTATWQVREDLKNALGTAPLMQVFTVWTPARAASSVRFRRIPVK